MIPRFKGEPTPLKKITREEVKNAARRMNNNKATGDDDIQLELLKYAPDILYDEIANNLNNVLETHTDDIDIGLSVLLPIQKPNKDIGPPKSLRPLNLLNAIRKILSLVTLQRIKAKADGYLSQSQAAYRENRSTTDIIWAHRFIAAKVMMYQNQSVDITGLDMSNAFDTVDREELMEILEEILDEDEVRMCRLLLSDTSMKLRFGKEHEETFKSNKGSPQGDAISGVFFNIAFENALRDLRSELNQNSPQLEHSYSKKSNLPQEMIYADDSDFPTQDTKRDEKVQTIANPVLSRHSLNVNDDKWEKTKIKRGKTKEDESDWRNTKKLGSLLGDYEDMKRRIQLSNAAMQSVEKVWPNKKITIQQKLKIYKTIVKRVLTYNFSTWGLTKAQTEELDRKHRKQLRILWNDKNMKNTQVYSQSGEKPISGDMKIARWRAFGHMLRLDEKAPCQQAMDFYFDVPENAKKFPGKRRITLPVKLNEDIKEAAKTCELKFYDLPNNLDIVILQFEDLNDLKKLRRVAGDRDEWRRIASIICTDAEGEWCL